MKRRYKTFANNVQKIVANNCSFTSIRCKQNKGEREAHSGCYFKVRLKPFFFVFYLPSSLLLKISHGEDHQMHSY